MNPRLTIWEDLNDLRLSKEKVEAVKDEANY